MDATVFSLEYGVPLYAFAKLATAFLSISDLAINYLLASTTLATPAESHVVLPNVDTLYSTAIYDLSQNDVVVTIPQVDAGRYWNFGFYDPYGDNFANIGSVNQNSSGDYLLQRALDCDRGHKYEAADEYQGHIKSPTTQGVLLVRDLVRNNGSDLAYVQNLVKEAKLTKIPRNHTKGYVGPPLTNATFTAYYKAGANTSLAIMELVAELAASNPPFNKSDTRHVEHELEAAGIHHGVYHPPHCVNLTLAYLEAQAAIVTYADTALVSLDNGWQHNVPQGTYGSNYVERSLVAVDGYLELTSDQTLYPIHTPHEVTLASNGSFIYTFSSKPPVSGFWSLTLYNSAGYLVANPLNKYSVGDRSNITYPNGTRVYGVNGTSTSGGDTGGEDGSFQVLVQPYNVSPPANWTSNWLPAPVDGSEFSITLRLYAPTSELEIGDWEYPVIAEGGAILV